MDTKNWRVKGTLLLDYVRMIKANKDRPWHKYLTPKDIEIIEGRVLPSVWYPYETFRRCGLATFHELAGSRLETVRAWGKIWLTHLVKEVYTSVSTEKDPLKAIERFLNLRKQFFNFEALSYEKVGEKHIKIRLYSVPDKESVEAFSAQLCGGIEQLIEITGGKNPRVTFNTKQSAKEAQTDIDVKWD